MDTNIITYLACICFIFIVGRIFILPLKKIFKLIINSILGGVCIYVINVIGANFGFHIGLNFFTSLIIRIIRIARSCLFNYCQIVDCIKVMIFIFGYSTSMVICKNGRRIKKKILVRRHQTKKSGVESFGFNSTFIVMLR